MSASRNSDENVAADRSRSRDGSRRKFVVVFIDTGHKYYLEETYGDKLRTLSAVSHGEVITFGNPGVITVDQFVVRSSVTLPSKILMTLRSLYGALQAVRRLKHQFGRVDLFITYDVLTTGLIGTVASIITSVPLAVEMNGDFTAESNYAHIKSSVKRALRKLINRAIASIVLRRAVAVKTLFRSQAEKLGLSDGKNRVVMRFPNFLSLHPFSNMGERKAVVIVGFPFLVKGIDIAISAFKNVSDDFPDWSLEILGFYVGADKESLDEAIGGHPQIRHLPPIPRMAMPEYIGRAGIVLCASRTEGFPRCIKEAMHARKPCIVSDVGGLPDLIQSEVNGLMFHSEDVAGLSAQLRRLMSDSSLRSKLSNAAFETASSEFSDERYLEDFRKFVERAVAVSRR